MTALEIRRDVEGYSGMNEDAFARRFYADRAELESLRHPADGREARRRRRRAGELLAAPGELPPPRDRVHRRGARRAAVRADPARRRVRLRRAAAPRAAADLVGPAQPAARARPALGRARRHRVGRRPRALAAPGEDRDGDLPQQDDHLRLLHDGARRGRRAQGRPVSPALPGRPVLPARPRARARRDPRLPALAHPRQGRLRDQGRARLQAPRATSTRAPTPTAPTGSSARPQGSGRDLGLRAHRLAGRAPLRPLRRGPPRPTSGRRHLLDRRTPSARQLASWVLRLGEHARVARAADELVARAWPSASSCCASATTATSTWPPRGAPAAGGRRPTREAPDGEPRPRGGDPARALRAPGHAGVAS